MKNSKDNVYDSTSNNFDGVIAVMSPEDSWVCKWQRISEYSILFYFYFGCLATFVCFETRSR